MFSLEPHEIVKIVQDQQFKILSMLDTHPVSSDAKNPLT